MSDLAFDSPLTDYEFRQSNTPRPGFDAMIWGIHEWYRDCHGSHCMAHIACTNCGADMDTWTTFIGCGDFVCATCGQATPCVRMWQRLNWEQRSRRFTEEWGANGFFIHNHAYLLLHSHIRLTSDYN